MKSFPLNLLLGLLIALNLSACASSDTTLESSMTLYSPSSIRLTAGQKIQTSEGAYTPQVDEVWHSHAEYMARVYEAAKH